MTKFFFCSAKNLNSQKTEKNAKNITKTYGNKRMFYQNYFSNVFSSEKIF